LLDDYLSDWDIRNPESEPFVSIKIFKFDPKYLTRKVISNVDLNKKTYEKKWVKVKKKTKQKIKTKISKMTDNIDPLKNVIMNSRKKIIKETEVVTIEEGPSYQVEIDTRGIHCNIETYDHGPDASMDIMRSKCPYIIDHTLIVKLPVDRAVVMNFNETKQTLIDDDVLTNMVTAESFEVELVEGYNPKPILESLDKSTNTNTFIQTLRSEVKLSSTTSNIDIDPINFERDMYLRYGFDSETDKSGLGYSSLSYYQLDQYNQLLFNERASLMDMCNSYRNENKILSDDLMKLKQKYEHNIVSTII
jgi:hypothetical protein